MFTALFARADAKRNRTVDPARAYPLTFASDTMAGLFASLRSGAPALAPKPTAPVKHAGAPAPKRAALAPNGPQAPGGEEDMAHGAEFEAEEDCLPAVVINAVLEREAPNPRIVRARKADGPPKAAVPVAVSAARVEWKGLPNPKAIPAAHFTFLASQPNVTFNDALAAHRKEMAAAVQQSVHKSIRKYSEKHWGTDPLVARARFLEIAVAMYTQGRAQPTWNARNSAVRIYTYFARTFLYDPFPTDPKEWQATLIGFAVWSAYRITIRSVKAYIGHVRARAVELDLAMPDNSSMPQLMQVCGGFERAHAAVKDGRVRLPMTFGVMTRYSACKREWFDRLPLAHRPGLYSMENPLMSEAHNWLTFYLAGRKSETCVTVTSTGYVSPPLLMKHYRRHPDRQLAIVSLKKRKNDQLGTRCDIVVGEVDHWLCACKAMDAWLEARRSAGEVITGDSLLFPVRAADGSFGPLGHAVMTHQLRVDLARAGYPAADYASHSFRIGAATTMALNGVPEYWIDDLGGWTRGKGGYKAYVHLNLAPQDERAKMSRFLTKTYVQL